jgi:hypothetical protein
MRQGGMAPKSHNSGIYWVRANANTGNGKQQSVKQESYEVVGYIVFALPLIIPILLIYLLYLGIKKLISVNRR